MKDGNLVMGVGWCQVKGQDYLGHWVIGEGGVGR